MSLGRRPQNWQQPMVERFNARVGEVIAQTRFKSSNELATTLLAYVRTYTPPISPARPRPSDAHTDTQIVARAFTGAVPKVGS